MGLGLAIVKSIASLHHGSIRISSEVGKGTRVTLLFPSEESSTS
ncbi:MAG TPA: ATP-binding protein [Gemmataceae bacterium]|nr:ATP-binding protein [Gemmataceae bacterium]